MILAKKLLLYKKEATCIHLLKYLSMMYKFISNISISLLISIFLLNCEGKHGELKFPNNLYKNYSSPITNAKPIEKPNPLLDVSDKVESPIKKKSSPRKLVDPQLLVGFFKEMNDLRVNASKGSFRKLATSLKLKSWKKDWKAVAKELKKQSPTVKKSSLDVATRIIKLADKRENISKKGYKKNVLEGIVVEFITNIKQISNVSKTNSVRRSILRSIYEVKQALVEIDAGCKQETKKRKFADMLRILCAFEKIITTES